MPRYLLVPNTFAKFETWAATRFFAFFVVTVRAVLGRIILEDHYPMDEASMEEPRIEDHDPPNGGSTVSPFGSSPWFISSGPYTTASRGSSVVRVSLHLAHLLASFPSVHTLPPSEDGHIRDPSKLTYGP